MNPGNYLSYLAVQAAIRSRSDVHFNGLYRTRPHQVPPSDTDSVVSNMRAQR